MEPAMSYKWETELRELPEDDENDDVFSPDVMQCGQVYVNHRRAVGSSSRGACDLPEWGWKIQGPRSGRA